jgi:hypothetical protein
MKKHFLYWLFTGIFWACMAVIVGMALVLSTQ